MARVILCVDDLDTIFSCLKRRVCKVLSRNYLRYLLEGNIEKRFPMIYATVSYFSK